MWQKERQGESHRSSRLRFYVKTYKLNANDHSGSPPKSTGRNYLTKCEILVHINRSLTNTVTAEREKRLPLHLLPSSSSLLSPSQMPLNTTLRKSHIINPTVSSPARNVQKNLLYLRRQKDEGLSILHYLHPFILEMVLITL